MWKALANLRLAVLYWKRAVALEEIRALRKQGLSTQCLVNDLQHVDALETEILAIERRLAKDWEDRRVAATSTHPHASSTRPWLRAWRSIWS